MPFHFKTTVFMSFLRQLSKYEFKRLPPRGNVFIYTHPSFRKNRDEELDSFRTFRYNKRNSNSLDDIIENPFVDPLKSNDVVRRRRRRNLANYNPLLPTSTSNVNPYGMSNTGTNGYENMNYDSSIYRKDNTISSASDLFPGRFNSSTLPKLASGFESETYNFSKAIAPSAIPRAPIIFPHPRNLSSQSQSSNSSTDFVVCPGFKRVIPSAESKRRNKLTDSEMIRELTQKLREQELLIQDLRKRIC